MIMGVKGLKMYFDLVEVKSLGDKWAGIEVERVWVQTLNFSVQSNLIQYTLSNQ